MESTHAALGRDAFVVPERLLKKMMAWERDFVKAGGVLGAWLFARVTSDGIAVRLERAFDSWPAWHQVSAPGEGPSMEDLAWEMQQRSPAWRPAWASLLPS